MAEQAQIQFSSQEKSDKKDRSNSMEDASILNRK